MSNPASLSSRQREVLHWFSLGKSAEDVAVVLGVSASTVMFHYRAAAALYGTSNRTQTVVEALRRREIEPLSTLPAFHDDQVFLP